MFYVFLHYFTHWVILSKGLVKKFLYNTILQLLTLITLVWIWGIKVARSLNFNCGKLCNNIYIHIKLSTFLGKVGLSPATGEKCLFNANFPVWKWKVHRFFLSKQLLLVWTYYEIQKTFIINYESGLLVVKGQKQGKMRLKCIKNLSKTLHWRIETVDKMPVSLLELRIQYNTTRHNTNT